MGYLGIDFVTFFDKAVGAQRLWAVDLNLRLTSTACSFALFNFLMGGEVRCATRARGCACGSPDELCMWCWCVTAARRRLRHVCRGYDCTAIVSVRRGICCVPKVRL